MSQVYLIPLRNDLDGMNIQITDLRPNDSQRNYIYDPPAQAGYLKWSLDSAGLTTTDGDSFAGGSTDTTPITALSDDSTTGAGDNVGVPGVAEFGLEAYLRDRVNADPTTANTALTIGQAATVAGDIRDLLQAGSPITVAAIDGALTAAVGAATDFDGATVGGSLSFGSVREVLRILRGEVYRVRALTIVTNDSGSGSDFLDLPVRQSLVDAQTAVQIASEGQFYAAGTFLEAGEPGYRAFRTLVRTGYFNISNGEGVIAGLKDFLDFNNPSFAYTAAAVTATRARAVTPDGTVVPENGNALGIAAYDALGNPL